MRENFPEEEFNTRLTPRNIIFNDQIDRINEPLQSSLLLQLFSAGLNMTEMLNF